MSVRFGGNDGLTGFALDVGRLLFKNEVSQSAAKAYTLSHAGTSQSGFSFGAVQWDLAKRQDEASDNPRDTFFREILALGGNDTVVTFAGQDQIYGDAGSDTLQAGAGDDHVFGGLDNDSLFGEADNDFLYGEQGTDNLIGGTGDDRLEGGGTNVKPKEALCYA